MSKGLKIFLAVIAAVLLFAVMAASSYFDHRNEIVTKKEAIKASWSQVDVVLQRRLDLIPNLVETVKGYAAHEEKVFADIAAARAAMMGAKSPSERIAANNQVDGALGRLFVMVENYPNLKANENFLRLQDELAGTENRIAVERKRYNDVVQDYNTYIQLFPNSIIASIGGFQREDAYFKTDEAARQAPKVSF
jgi:LemA protein